MKIRTDLKSGDVLGQCYPVFNSLGVCKHLKCPFPPYKFPCNSEDFGSEGPVRFYTEGEDASADALRR